MMETTGTRRPGMAAIGAVLSLAAVVGPVRAPAGAAGINDDGLRFEITSGPEAGEYPAGEPYWTIPVWGQPGGVVRGPVVYGGYGCPDDRQEIPDPSVLGQLGEGDRSIIVFQRGPTDDPNEDGSFCYFGPKVESGQLAGYDVVVIANHHGGAQGGTTPDAVQCDPPGYDFNPTVVGVCIGHRAFHHVFSTTPDYTVPYPPGDPSGVEPDVGDVGHRIRVTSMGMPMLASHSALGQGWSTYAVLSPGGTIEFPIRLDGEVSPGQIGAWLYSSSDEFLGGVAFSSWRSEVSYSVAAHVADQEIRAEDAVLRERHGFMSMTANVTTQGPAVFKILLWAAARKPVSWQSAARGPEGSRLLGAEHGTSSFIARSKEFDAPANVEADAVAGVRAVARGEYVVEVEDTLTATFLPPFNDPANVGAAGVQANHMSIVTPRGEWQCAVWSCGFTDFSGPARAGPGTYRFRLTGAGAGVSDDVLLSGADARLPEAHSAIGALEAAREGDALAVSGWAAFAGASPALVGDDPMGDAGALPSELGYDLTGAYVGQPDPGSGDLRFVTSLAGAPPPFGTPEAARYLWDIGVRTDGGTAVFQVDGKLTDIAGSGSTRIPVFVLRGPCTGQPGQMACPELADLDAWMDGHHDTIEVTVPRVLLEQHVSGSLEGAEIIPAEALHGIATASKVGAAPADTLAPAGSPYHRVASPRIQLALTRQGEAPHLISPATLLGDGTFTASLDLSSVPPGERELHAWACFGGVCGPAQVVHVSI